MSKAIPIESMKNARGRAMKLPERDADGDVVWENPDAKPEQRIPKLIDADTKLALYTFVYARPNSIEAKNDSLRDTQLFNALERATNGQIELKDTVYDWIHRALGREVPVTPQAKEMDIKPRLYSYGLFGRDEFVALLQLKDLDERPADILVAADDADPED